MLGRLFLVLPRLPALRSSISLSPARQAISAPFLKAVNRLLPPNPTAGKGLSWIQIGLTPSCWTHCALKAMSDLCSFWVLFWWAGGCLPGCHQENRL